MKNCSDEEIKHDPNGKRNAQKTKLHKTNKNTYLLTFSASKKVTKGKKESDGMPVILFGYNRTLKDK